MKNVLLKSPAKVNLFLKIGNKIKSKKYHNIQSLIFPINLNDEISISETNKTKDIVKFTGKFKGNIKNKNNSVSNSISLLRKNNIINKNIRYKIIVKKNIPVFSGLGGGSSNAATIINYFMKNRKISKNEIKSFSKSLGSDFRVFLKGKKTFQESFSKIYDLKLNFNFYLLIIYPFLKCSTKEIYSKFKKYEFIQKNKQFKKISKLDLVNKLKLENNSLENIIISKFPIVDNILEELESIKKCEFSRVTGSGSACFALFLNKNDGATALKRIKKRFPRFWSRLCKTI